MTLLQMTRGGKRVLSPDKTVLNLLFRDLAFPYHHRHQIHHMLPDATHHLCATNSIPFHSVLSPLTRKMKLSQSILQQTP